MTATTMRACLVNAMNRQHSYTKHSSCQQVQPGETSEVSSPLLLPFTRIKPRYLQLKASSLQADG